MLCVCVCVCVRARARARKRERESVCACARERESARVRGCSREDVAFFFFRVAERVYFFLFSPLALREHFQGVAESRLCPLFFRSVFPSVAQRVLTERESDRERDRERERERERERARLYLNSSALLMFPPHFFLLSVT